MPDPDLEVREGGGQSPKKKFFQPFRPQFGLKIRREEGPLGHSPGSPTEAGLNLFKASTHVMAAFPASALALFLFFFSYN